MPVFDMTETAFLGNNFDVWSIGISPVKIEVMTAVKGLDFDKTFKMSQIYQEDDLDIRFIHLSHLIKAKKSSRTFS